MISAKYHSQVVGPVQNNSKNKCKKGNYFSKNNNFTLKIKYFLEIFVEIGIYQMLFLEK
jgi:hypothetical protein